MDWNDRAKRVADYIHKNMIQVSRGAVSFGAADCAVLFGNDGYDQGEGKGALLVEQLRANTPANYAEAGFSTSDAGNGTTWAIIVRAHMGMADLQALNHFVWDSYGKLFPGHESQVAQQREMLYPHIKPLAEPNNAAAKS